jgi:hypothetical protein
MAADDEAESFCRPFFQVDAVMFFYLVLPGIKKIIDVSTVIEMTKGVTIIESYSVKCPGFCLHKIVFLIANITPGV